MSDTTRVGDWMQTATGRKFWPLDPRPDDVHLEDIARALSNVCRFGGHCRTFYSVAEHSVRVSNRAEWHARDIHGPEDVRNVSIAGLLHDASEAYIGDMVRPLKRQPGMDRYRAAERAIMIVTAAAFGLPVDWLGCASVHNADEELLATEARDIMGGESAGKWTLRAEPLTDRIVPLSPADAYAAFMARAAQLEVTT